MRLVTVLSRGNAPTLKIYALPGVPEAKSLEYFNYNLTDIRDGNESVLRRPFAIVGPRQT
jgi:hypothetical protein